MKVFFAIVILFSVTSQADPVKGDTAIFNYVKEDGTKQTWKFVVTDSDMRLFSAKVFLEENGIKTDDLLLGSTPIMNRLMKSAESDENCRAELDIRASGGSAVIENVTIAGKAIPTCHIHTFEDGVTYDAWYADVPFGKVKLKISGGNRPGRYMVEPGEGVLSKFLLKR